MADQELQIIIRARDLATATLRRIGTDAVKTTASTTQAFTGTGAAVKQTAAHTEHFISTLGTMGERAENAGHRAARGLGRTRDVTDILTGKVRNLGKAFVGLIALDFGAKLFGFTGPLDVIRKATDSLAEGMRELFLTISKGSKDSRDSMAALATDVDEMQKKLSAAFVVVQTGAGALRFDKTPFADNLTLLKAFESFIERQKAVFDQLHNSIGQVDGDFTQLAEGLTRLDQRGEAIRAAREEYERLVKAAVKEAEAIAAANEPAANFVQLVKDAGEAERRRIQLAVDAAEAEDAHNADVTRHIQETERKAREFAGFIRAQQRDDNRGFAGLLKRLVDSGSDRLRALVEEWKRLAGQMELAAFRRKLGFFPATRDPGLGFIGAAGVTAAATAVRASIQVEQAKQTAEAVGAANLPLAEQIRLLESGKSALDGLRFGWSAVTTGVTEAERTMAQFRIGFEGAVDIWRAGVGGLSDLITNVATGTKSIGDAWEDLKRTVINAIAQMIAKMLALKATQAAFSFFGISATPQAGTTFALGGIGPAVQRALPLRAAALGGVTNGPTMMIAGEGRHRREAFVPLPDGRSIPVEMRGGGAPTINFNITAADTRDFDRLLAERRSMIESMIERALVSRRSLRTAVRAAT